MVGNLALQVQLLLLEVEQGGMPAGASDADVVLGYASLGVLFSAMQTVRLEQAFCTHCAARSAPCQVGAALGMPAGQA